MAKALVEHDLVTGDLDIRKLNQDWVYQSLRDEIGGVEQYPDYFPYAGANNLGIKRTIHNAIGGFDLELLALQDVDYCWRAQQTGVKLESVRGAIVNFRFSSSLRGMCKRRYKQGIYNVYLHNKHGLHIDWQSVTKHGLFLLPIFVTKRWDKSSLARWGMRLAWCLGPLEGRRRFGVV